VGHVACIRSEKHSNGLVGKETDLLEDLGVDARSFYGEGSLTPHSVLMVKDHPLSAAVDYLFNAFAATLRIWKLAPPSATRGHVTPW